MLPVPSQPHPSDDDPSDPAQPFVSVDDLDDDFEPIPIATIPSPDRRANRKRRRGEGSSTISQAVDTAEVKKNLMYFFLIIFCLNILYLFSIAIIFVFLFLFFAQPADNKYRSC